MSRMSELAADIEKAAMIIANDNYDLRTQLVQLRLENQRLAERIVGLQQRKSVLMKACQQWAAKYYQLAEDHGIALKEDA